MLSEVRGRVGWGLTSLNNVKVSCGQYGQRAFKVLTQILWDEFQQRRYSVISPKFRLNESLNEGENNDSPLLCYARVYIFAKMYDMTNLRSLALNKLHQALYFFKVITS